MSDQTTTPNVDAPPPQPQAPPVSHTYAVLCHVLALSGFVGVPFGHIIGPLIIWLLKRSESAVVDQHGKESLNFQISMTLWSILAGLTIFILIGFVLLPLLILANIVLVIIASIKAGNGEFYKYPLTIRFLK